MPFSCLPPFVASCFTRPATALDPRSAARLPVLLAKGRRACTAWLSARGTSHDFRRAYNVVGACGRRAEPVATRLLPALGPALSIVVGRSACIAAPRDLPLEQPKGKRGPKPARGKSRVVLKLRAGQPRGWEELTCWQYGLRVTKLAKTFLATWRPAGGVIRVALVQGEDHGDNWRAYFCTKPDATTAEILEVAAQRTAIEQTFKDSKEVWGGGSAAGEEPARQRGMLQPERLDVQRGRGVGLVSPGRGAGGPGEQPVGQGVPQAASRRQAQGVTAACHAGGN